MAVLPTIEEMRRIVIEAELQEAGKTQRKPALPPSLVCHEQVQAEDSLGRAAVDKLRGAIERLEISTSRFTPANPEPPTQGTGIEPGLAGETALQFRAIGELTERIEACHEQVERAYSVITTGTT